VNDLCLPGFSAENNWQSRLRDNANMGFKGTKDGKTDFNYHDIDGKLTRCIRKLQLPYRTPNWLETVLDDGNRPHYWLEVKSTPEENPKTPFFMSKKQYKDVSFNNSSPVICDLLTDMAQGQEIESRLRHTKGGLRDCSNLRPQRSDRRCLHQTTMDGLPGSLYTGE
jgi:hypothetical protein